MNEPSMNNGQGSHFPPYFFLKIEKRIVVNCDIVQVRSCPAVEVVIHIARKWAGFMKEQFPYATAQKSRKGGRAKRGSGSPFFTTKTNTFLTNVLSGFALVVFESVLGPSCMARHTRQCSCFTKVSEAKFVPRMRP